MNSTTSVPLAYRAAMRAARLASPLLGLGRSKLARGMRGRRRAHEVLQAWGEERRDPDRPTVWFHAPSVGEGLQAQAVAEALRARRPELQLVYTHFSPSAEPLARRFGADVATYLPWDLAAMLGRALDAIRPELLVFTKTEVWPVLVAEARARGVPVALVAASVPPGAGRRRWPARTLLRSTWGRLALACACAEEDAAGLVELGVPAGAVRVTGDPGIDSAAERAAGADPTAPYLAPFHAQPRPTVIAGSTWPADEAVLLPALAAVRRARGEGAGRGPGGSPERSPLRLIVAPHEPTADRVGALLGSLMQGGWHPATLSHVEGEGVVGDADAVVVDRVGVLAHLYTVGRVAYVGGGFHGAGLHSVLEPAAAGLPVLFGPRHHNARAAADLLSAGGAARARDPVSTAEILKRWLDDADAFDYAARSALGYIAGHRGSAARTAAFLDESMKPHRSDDPIA